MSENCRAKCAVYFCCCLCGGLPIIALAKAIVVMPFSLIIMGSGCTLGALLMLPRDIILSYRAVAETGVIGPNLKALAMLHLPIAFVLWPPFVLLASCAAGIIWPIAVALQATFDDNEFLLFGGCLISEREGNPYFPTIQDACSFTKDFWDFNAHSIFAVIEDFRMARRHGGAFDIRILTLFVLLVETLLCSAYLMALAALLAVLKGPFLLIGAYFRAFVKAVEGFCELHGGFKDFGAFMVVWCVGPVACVLCIAGIPVGAVIGTGLVIIGSGFAGMECAVQAYQHYFLAAFSQAINHSRTLDGVSTGAIIMLLCNPESGGDPPTCFPYIDIERHTGELADIGRHTGEPADAPETGTSSTLPSSSSINSVLGNLPMQKVWDNFFDQCEKLTADALRGGVITAEHLEGMEPFVVVGVPALVILKAAHRSLYSPENAPELGVDDWLLADGVVMTKDNRPRNPVANMLIDPVLTLKQDLRNAALDSESWQRLFDAALLQDADRVADVACSPSATKLLSDVNGIAITVSRLPQFRRRFGDSIKLAISHAAEAPSPLVPQTVGAVGSA